MESTWTLFLLITMCTDKFITACACFDDFMGIMVFTVLFLELSRSSRIFSNGHRGMPCLMEVIMCLQ